MNRTIKVLTLFSLLAISTLVFGGFQSAHIASAQEDTKALAQAWVDAQNAAIASGDPTAYLALYSSDYTDPMLPSGTNAMDALKQNIMQIHTAFPDGKLTVQDIVASDTEAAVYTTASGTNTGSFAGAPASGKAFKDVAMADFLTFKNGKIVKDVNVTDSITLLSSIGWNLTPPGGAGAMGTPPATP